MWSIIYQQFLPEYCAQKRKHTGDKKPFSCSEYEVTMDSKKHFEKHNKRHSGGKDNKCHECDSTFLIPIELKMHTDVNLRAYKCFQCNKHVSSKTSLKHHMRVHLGVKSESCVHCKKSFIDKADLLTYGVIYLTGHLLKISKYKQVSLGKVRCI